jgi:hypothetical protein
MDRIRTNYPGAGDTSSTLSACGFFAGCHKWFAGPLAGRKPQLGQGCPQHSWGSSSTCRWQGLRIWLKDGDIIVQTSWQIPHSFYHSESSRAVSKSSSSYQAHLPYTHADTPEWKDGCCPNPNALQSASSAVQSLVSGDKTFPSGSYLNICFQLPYQSRALSGLT